MTTRPRAVFAHVVLGVAALAAVWALGGGTFDSGPAFTQGLRAALVTSVALTAAALVLSLRVPRPGTPSDDEAQLQSLSKTTAGRAN